jgi:hypothetical protein
MRGKAPGYSAYRQNMPRKTLCYIYDFDGEKITAKNSVHRKKQLWTDAF